ncbi:MAG: hypothetical protein U0270_14580 [Labilithrix sp.]
MAKLKAVSANCPSCGAGLPVMPGVPQITCRYCQNVITVEMRSPPPEVRPFGTPGAIPSRTLYIDPKVAQAAQAGGRVVLAIVLVTTVLPLVLVFGGIFGGGCIRSCTSAIHPYPIACGLNDDVTVSGNWEGAGPVVTEAGVNCKIHIKNAKIKAPTFLTKASTNFELTLENTTIETTDTMFKLDSNPKVHLINSTLVSQGLVFDADSNLLIESEGSTIESKGGTAIKAKYNLKLHATNTKVRGKKAAIETDSNFELTLKKGSEITATDARAIKATSSMKLEAEGGKIAGGLGAIVTSSGLTISGTGLTISTPKDKAIEVTSGLKIDLTDSSITSTADEAIEGDSGMELVLANTTVQGRIAIETKSGLKIKASKKSRIVGAAGNGITTTSNADISLADASIEGATMALKTDSSARLKLGPGSRIAGKRAGIYSESGLTIDGTNTSIEGGAGPGLRSTFVGNITIHDSVIKGTPGIQIERAPTPMDLANTRVDGGQVVSKP